jgi:type III secretion protein S
MDHSALIHHLNTSLILVLYLSGPVLAVAASVGLIVGLLQAVTQVQDQSLPQTFKLISILLTVAIAGPLLGGSLVRETQQVFDQFPALTRQ